MRKHIHDKTLLFRQRAAVVGLRMGEEPWERRAVGLEVTLGRPPRTPETGAGIPGWSPEMSNHGSNSDLSTQKNWAVPNGNCCSK